MLRSSRLGHTAKAAMVLHTLPEGLAVSYRRKWRQRHRMGCCYMMEQVICERWRPYRARSCCKVCFHRVWRLWNENRRKGLGMQLGADVLDLDELKGALPRHRNLEWVVDGTARRVRTKDDSLSRWGSHLRCWLGCHCHNLEGNCAP